MDAYQQVLQSLPDTCLVIAPRHLERVEAIEQLLRARGFQPRRRSTLPLPTNQHAQVVIVDTFGELASLYSVADVAVVGAHLPRLAGRTCSSRWRTANPSFWTAHAQLP